MRPIILYQAILLLLILISTATHAQRQLILLKRGTVIARFNEGENIRCITKGKKITEGVVVRFNDFSINTLNDTIFFESIEKIHVKGRRKANTVSRVGTVLMIAGIGYFAIDQINGLFFVDGQSGIDENVAITAVSLAGVGAALRYIRSPYQKVRGISLRVIDPTSRYYRYE